MEAKPKLTHEQARKAYHDATVEMATIDAKLIDAAATLEELKTAHGQAIIRVNEAREGLVEARSPSLSDATTNADALAAARQTRKDKLTDHLLAARFIQDETPESAVGGDLWVRPAALEVLKFEFGAWTARNFTNHELRELFTIDEILALKTDPRRMEKAA